MATVASVYSKALFNVARTEGSVKKVEEELRRLSDVCNQSPEVQKVLFNSLFDSKSREKVADSIASELGVSDLTKKFFKLIALKNRSSYLDVIRESFELLANAETGVLRGRAAVATKLGTAELKELTAAISNKVGSAVELEQEEDNSLIGGFVVQAGGKTFDSSIRTQLRKLQEVCLSQ